MCAAHQDAGQRCQELRKVAVEIAQESAAPSIRFGLINAAALAAAKHWEGALESDALKRLRAPKAAENGITRGP